MTQPKTSVTLTIEQPGKDPHKMQVTMPSEHPSGEDIVGLVQQLLIWAEDHYSTAFRETEPLAINRIIAADLDGGDAYVSDGKGNLYKVSNDAA